jgi:outer membrane protein assembly factor BamB
MKLLLGIAALAVTVLVAGCASDKPKPTPLATITPTLAVQPAWTAQVDASKFIALPTLRSGTLVLTGGDSNGSVLGLEAATGKTLWQANFGQSLSAPAGSDGRFTAGVSLDNELIVLDQGKPVWRAQLSSRVATPPLVAGERVFVLGVDRSVRAYDAATGRYLWLLQRAGDSLTLSQPGVLAAYQDSLLVGQGHRLAALDPTRGSVKWEIPLANPRGTNEVERVADLVGPAARQGSTLCVRSFQTAVACADLQNASMTWSKPAGGIQALGADAQLVVGADNSGRISAWRAASGDLAWSSETLLHRDLSGMALTSKVAVVGDLEGQVHFLDRTTGQIVQRMATDGSAIVGTPVLTGELVIVNTRRGGVFAFRLG